MHDKKLLKLLETAEKSGSFFLTLTVKDGDKDENNLLHFVERREFSIDDIIPSLDASVCSLGIKSPPIPSPKAPPNPPQKERSLKIAIITHFNRSPDSYSPGRAAKRIVRTLKENGHRPVFFTVEGSTLDMGCEMRDVVPKFKREKGVVNENEKKRTVDMLRRELVGFDVAISIDLYIDDAITYREAIKECSVPVQWLHWARSGIGRPIDFYMPNAFYVYMNIADSEIFSDKIGVPYDKVRIVYNDADPAIMFGWNDITKEISDRMRLWEKDIIQAYPMCTTRMDAKGINSAISIFAELKRMGKKVALIICNSNGRKRIDDISRKISFAQDQGLTCDEDIIFTSTLPEALGTASEVPHIVVTELMRISNLFIFPTIAEVCPNVLLEASMGKNLVVINDDLPLLRDFTGFHNVLSYPFNSSRNLHYKGKTTEEMERLARSIIGEIDSNKADRQFRKVWRTHCLDSIYSNQLRPVLFEAAELTSKK